MYFSKFQNLVHNDLLLIEEKEITNIYSNKLLIFNNDIDTILN